MKKAKAKKSAPRSTGKHDVELGNRDQVAADRAAHLADRTRRSARVSFQQVQKYEKGVNRVGAARLQQIATALDVPVTFFYDGDGKTREVESLLFLDSSFSLRLLRAYAAIKDQTVQRQLVTFME
jgi:transcriptional regulator with XRE-family HTH domain